MKALDVSMGRYLAVVLRLLTQLNVTQHQDVTKHTVQKKRAHNGFDQTEDKCPDRQCTAVRTHTHTHGV